MLSLRVICLSTCILMLLCIIVNAKNMTWGSPRRFDHLLSRDFVKLKSIPGLVRAKNVTYPPKGQSGYTYISAIRAWDWGGQKNYSKIVLLDGGPGYPNVTLRLKTRRGKGLNVTLEYYGRHSYY